MDESGGLLLLFLALREASAFPARGTYAHPVDPPSESADGEDHPAVFLREFSGYG
jgi:hypothetical protein